MAFTPINPAEIAADQPVKQELWEKVRTDFDDHETRITSNTGSLQLFLPINFTVKGAHYLVGPIIGLDFFRSQSAIKLTNGTLWLVDDLGTSGTLTIDVQVSTNGGASYSSLFTVKPSLTSAAPALATDVGTLDATKVNINSADVLRLDVDSFQVGNFEFQVLLEFEAQ